MTLAGTARLSHAVNSRSCFLNSDPPLRGDLTVEVSTWLAARAASPERYCFSSQAWSNARLSLNDAGSSSSRRGRRARSHGGQSVACLVCFLKWLRWQSLDQQHVAVTSFCAFMWDGVREDSGRGSFLLVAQMDAECIISIPPILLHC